MSQTLLDITECL